MEQVKLKQEQFGPVIYAGGRREILIGEKWQNADSGTPRFHGWKQPFAACLIDRASCTPDGVQG